MNRERSEGSRVAESIFCPSRAIDKPFLSHNLDPDWMDYFFESRLSCSWAHTIFELLYLAWLTTTLSRWTIVFSTPQWPPIYLDWITTLPTYVSYFSFYYDFGYLEGLIELDRPIRLSESWRWSFSFLVASCEFPLLLTVFCPAFKRKAKEVARWEGRFLARGLHLFPNLFLVGEKGLAGELVSCWSQKSLTL